MEEEYKTEWIDQYLDNELDSQERIDFERLMEEDHSFRQEVEAQRAVRSSLQAWGENELKGKFKQFHARMQQETEAPSEATVRAKETPVRKLWHQKHFWWAAASVSLLLLAGVFWLSQNTIEQEAVSEGNIEQTIHVPVSKVDGSSLGYAGEETDRDSVVVALISSEQYPFHYRFVDTLKLYLRDISLADQIALEYHEPTAAYTILMHGKRYKIDRNFNRIRALQEE